MNNFAAEYLMASKNLMYAQFFVRITARNRFCIFTAHEKMDFFPGQDTRIRFSLEPSPGDPGFVQWKDAMKMVARLPEGVPEEFRSKVKWP